MHSNSALTTSEILAVFTEEIVARGGHVTDTFNDGRRLLTRSVLPQTDEVRPGDQLQAGVALRATEKGIRLYPYFYRLVCRNGAIAAQTISSHSLGDLHQQDPAQTIEHIREAVEICCAKEVFADIVNKAQASADAQVDLDLDLMPMLAALLDLGDSDLLSLVMEMFFKEEDHTQFGLANAVARDVEDPQVRWDLEEFGGSLAIASSPLPTDEAHAAIDLALAT